jgi:outer membrane lipopolysaccharide assembly protein LptE/RlpB
LIITENGKSFPLLKCYDKNISLKDLGVTRYSKLKYKVVRMETKDLKDAMLGKNQRNFFEQENIIKETDDEGAVMKEMRKDMAKKLKRMNPNIMWMASESEIKCEIPEYLRAPFIE